ncbi:M20 family metallopeptidase [Gordonia defluvii]|jgi:acetylornithine deacetylase|uniref:M20 family metallopeptidase n=1 Tax=Gordonia defluvii TaxID=283718 RepID=A0ABP6LBH6_9ACTN|nr:M20 family metallopeptidase [Gordonia sp. UBA5067]
MTPLLTGTEEALLRQLTADPIVALTTSLIAERSENPGATEATTVAVLADACRNAGLAVDVVDAAPGRPNLVATLPGPSTPGPALLFLGHSDVVPAGTGWSQDPFGARVSGGRLTGRGAADMKGGLAAIVAAMGVLARAGLGGRVEFVCTADEEAGGLGARAYVARRARAGNVLGCIVAEPTRLRAVHAGRGTANVAITVTGKAAHSGRPGDGCSAIAVAGRILAVIADDGERLARRPHPELGAATWNVGTIAGGQGINVVAADCRLGVDRRLLPDEEIAVVAAGLRAQIAALGLPAEAAVIVAVDSETPAFATAADDPLTVGVGEALASLGLDPAPRVWSAACDAGFLHRDLGIRSIVLGPGDINDQAHQADESVAVDDLLTAAKLYTLIAHRLLAR